MYKPWLERMDGFRIFGNLYFVGCRGASSHIIDTGSGLIMLDTGYPQTLYLIIENIYKIGFRTQDIKYIIHSHGHYDHLGATKALVELTGAKTFLGAGDREYANGKADLTWAKELGHTYYEMFEPDCLLYDKDVIELGNTKIACVASPGHTPGTMSYFFDVTDGKRIYRAGTHGGTGINTLQAEFLDRYGLSYDCRKDFMETLERLKKEKVDIFIGNHVWNNDTIGKYERMQKGEANPFVNPGEWQRFLKKTQREAATLF